MAKRGFALSTHFFFLCLLWGFLIKRGGPPVTRLIFLPSLSKKAARCCGTFLPRRRRFSRDDVVFFRTGLEEEARVLHDGMRARVAQWIGVIDSCIGIGQREPLF